LENGNGFIELAPGILSFENVFLDGYAMAKSIENSSRWQKAEVLVDEENGVSGKNYTARDTDLLQLRDDVDGDVKAFRDKFLYETDNNISTYLSYYYASVDKKEPPQLLRYGVNQKFHDHIDDHPALGVRRVSLSLYLNDNYDGGEIIFPRFNLKIKPKANQLILFPSSYVYNHEIVPVTHGERYVVVQWMG